MSKKIKEIILWQNEFRVEIFYIENECIIIIVRGSSSSSIHEDGAPI